MAGEMPFMSENKISVFGSTGFIGSRFCELNSENVVRVERNNYEPQSKNILYMISTVDNYNVHSNLHVDVDTNLKVLMNVLDNVKDKSNITFNFVSSWFVYGKNHEIPFREDYSKCSPTGFYSITKRCAEQLLISFCETYNIKYRVFRLANVLGVGDNKISKKKTLCSFLSRRL